MTTKRTSKPAEENEASIAQTEAATPTVGERAPADTRTSVTVSWRGNSRTYSKAVHGEHFLALAEEFATKFNGTLV